VDQEHPPPYPNTSPSYDSSELGTAMASNPSSLYIYNIDIVSLSILEKKKHSEITKKQKQKIPTNQNMTVIEFEEERKKE
jgi:hypothetical protein